ncbi:MAG: DUF3426 domain-containing protein [Emcibacteraceae bacterium]
MILTCPECKSRYVVNPAALMPRGRTVRCAKCSHSWFEQKPDESVFPAAARTPQNPVATEPEKSGDNEELKEQNNKSSQNENTATENTDNSSSESGEEDFDFPINKPPKRRRPVPKGSNLPALQNQKYGSNKVGWISLAVFVTAVICSFMIFQDAIIKSWPASKKLYVAIGLEEGNVIKAPVKPELAPIEERLSIGGITPRRENVNNVSNLVISGFIENISSEIQSVPAIKIMLLDSNRRNIREWSVQPQKSQLNPAERVNFETSLPSPPPEAKDISIDFVKK